MDSLYSGYAAALLSIARDEKRVNEYKDAIKLLMDVFAADNEGIKFLESRFIVNEEKYKFIDSFTKDFGLDNLSSFLKVIVKNNRVHELNKIFKEFIEISNRELGVEEGYVYSVNKLSKEQLKNIENAIGTRLNKPVELTNLIDKSLLGGVKVIVNDHLFDASIKNKVTNLKNTIKERRG